MHAAFAWKLGWKWRLALPGQEGLVCSVGLRRSEVQSYIAAKSSLVRDQLHLIQPLI